MYSRFTEPDLYRHIGNERNALDVTRIDIEGLRNQRVVLTVPINTKLRPFEDYTLIIRQPIPHTAQGLPLYVRAVADMDFFPDVSVGFGIKIDDNDDGHGSDRHSVEKALEANDEFVEGGVGCENDCGVEVIKKRIEAKIFPVTIAPNGNQAFGENLTNGRADEPRPFIKLYLNNLNQFVVKKCVSHKCGYPKKRVVVVKEVITSEPKSYNAINRDILATPYGHEKKFRSHDYFVENGCGHSGYCW